MRVVVVAVVRWVRRKRGILATSRKKSQSRRGKKTTEDGSLRRYERMGVRKGEARAWSCSYTVVFATAHPCPRPLRY